MLFSKHCAGGVCMCKKAREEKAGEREEKNAWVETVSSMGEYIY